MWAKAQIFKRFLTVMDTTQQRVFPYDIDENQPQNDPPRIRSDFSPSTQAPTQQETKQKHPSMDTCLRRYDAGCYPHVKDRAQAHSRILKIPTEQETKHGYLPSQVRR